MRRTALALAVPFLVLSVLTGGAITASAGGSGSTGTTVPQLHPPKCC
jgi:hypothetical protein